MINRLFRYFKGYLRIRISGNSVERFINACSHKGICLWELSSNQSNYEMNITVSDFRNLKPVIRKTNTKVVIVNRAGFPFFLNKYQKRKLLFTGFFICVFIIYLLSTHIWNISINGNLSHTNETLIEFLETLDVKKGMKINNVSCSEIVQKIRGEFDEIIWVSASIEGTNLIIQIKENEDSKVMKNIQQDNTTEPYNIVSDRSCQITKIIIRNGIVNVKEGNSVNKGDLLVSGQIPVLNDEKEIIDYQYCISDADIYGMTTLAYMDQISRTYYEKKPSVINKKEYFLNIGKYRLSLGSIKNDYLLFSEFSWQKNFNGFIAGKRSVYPYETIAKVHSKAEVREILSINFKHYCEELEKKGVVILQNDVKIYTWSDKAKAIGNLTVEMPVGQLKKAEFIEIGDNINGNDGNDD